MAVLRENILHGSGTIHPRRIEASVIDAYPAPLETLERLQSASVYCRNGGSIVTILATDCVLTRETKLGIPTCAIPIIKMERKLVNESLTK